MDWDSIIGAGIVAVACVWGYYELIVKGGWRE